MKPLRELKVKVIKMEFHKCTVCPKAFLDVNELATHTKRHQDMLLTYALSAYVKLERVKIFGCDRCRRGFLSERLLLLHRLDHVKKTVNPTLDIYFNKDKEKPHKCPECEYAFVVKSSLDAHLVIHEPFQHICFCGIGYYKQEDLHKHQKLVQCIKPEIKDTKPPNRLIKTEEKIKIHPIFKKIKKKKANGSKSKSRSKIWTPLPMPPLDVEFKRKDNNQFECPECLKLFDSLGSVEKHYRPVHRGERPYPCHLCEKRFTQSGALNTHLIIHSGVKKHECQYCKKLFYTVDAKIRHERTHTGYKPYKCSYCSKMFSDPSACQRHKRIHTGDFRYQCDLCPMAFTDSSGLYAHRKRHNPERSRDYACSQCNKTFHTKQSIKKHVSIVHNKEYNYPCEICGKKFSCSLNLETHVNVHHVVNRKKHPCNICGKKFLERNYLNLHMKHVHRAERKYFCEFCSGQFTEKGLIKHMIVHTEIKKYECDYCSLKMRYRTEIHAHILAKHVRIRCKICSRYFPSLSGLEKHKLKTSEKCSICESEFFCKNSLETHSLVHLKEPKTFECDYCKQVFMNRNDITKHIALHIKNKFKCDHCGDHFEDKDFLRKHMLRHSKVSCKVCRKRFYSKFDLYKHKKVGCIIRKFGCSMCDRSFKLTRNLVKHEARCLRGVPSEEVKCPLCAKLFLSKRRAIKHLESHTDVIKTVESP